MSVYHINEATLALPKAFQDKSVNIFTLTEDNQNSEFNIVISRDSLSQGERLEHFVSRQLEALKSKVPAFQIHSRSETHINSRQGVLVEFSWKSGSETIRQRQVSVMAGKSVLTLTGTARGEFNAGCERLWLDFIEGMLLRD